MAQKQFMPPMSDEQLAAAHDRQTKFSLTGSALGLTGLGLLGASVAARKKPNVPHQLSAEKAEKVRRWGTNASITAGGVGALSGINFARIQNEESRRTREIKKSNYGVGYSQYYRENDDSVGVAVAAPTRPREKSPFTISRKAHDPERAREMRANAYPVVMGGGAVGTGALTVREAMKKKPAEKVKVQTKTGEKVKRFPLKDVDAKILRSKPARVAAGTAATGGLAYGAYYNAQKKNRASYQDNWYPDYER